MRLILVLACLLVPTGRTIAMDYDKIERKLRKEPIYQTKKPGYALLLFGQKAQLAVWVVLDGKTLYVDRNGNGDLTEKGEKFTDLTDCKNVEIRDPDGKTRYVIQRVQTHPSYYTAAERRERQAKGIRANLDVEIDIKGSATYTQRCDLQEMWDDPKRTQLAHFHGPLTVEVLKYNFQIPKGLNLKVVDGEAEVVAVVGTMSQKHGCWVVLGSSTDTARRPTPPGLHPVVEIDFPPAQPKGKPIRRKYELKEFC
jgi:hypothetical protein